MKLFGLIGYPLNHSFSEKFFSEKFSKEKINAEYRLFPIENIELFSKLLAENPNLCGINVTIPYKEKIIPFLDELDETAKEIGAVNVIKITHNNHQPVIAGLIRNLRKNENNEGLQIKSAMILKGYNSDIIGFENSLRNIIKPSHKKALILGTGGAAKGVAFVLKKMHIDYKIVSRTPKKEQFSYSELTPEIIKDYTLIINTTPSGTYPNVNECPNIPYEALTENHLLYDLIYNPEKTLFLKKGETQGAAIKNGLEMLHGQAIAAWEIWNKQ
jgi:shikimate dehydrogenase